MLPTPTAHQPGAAGSLRPLKPPKACKTVPRRVRGLDEQTRRTGGQHQLTTACSNRCSNQNACCRLHATATALFGRAGTWGWSCGSR